MGKHFFRKKMAVRHLKKAMEKKKAQSILVFLEGPHGSGKTFVVHKFAKKHKRTTILSCRDVVKRIGKKESDLSSISASSLGECIVLDNVEYLRGRDQTQERMVQLIGNWRKNGTHVIVSGVDTKNRLPKFVELLGEADYSVDLS